ncbi:hypothetical protein BJX61DRAFT_314572 [Aspergillus egyptiacus]|nr:hypothetical protein BJX61DRAFT_314572 [Aspergillus egyptiacus]
MGKKRKRPLKNKTHGESKQHPYRVDGSITPSEPEVSHPVLSLYYYQVVTLRQYILQRIPRSSKSRRRRIAAVRSDNAVDGSTDRGHGQDLAGLLDTTLVGIRDELSPTHCQERRRDFIAHTQAQVVSQLNTDTGPQSLQSEIVDFVISSFFTRSGASYQRPDHLLGHGFRHTTQARSSFALPCSIYRVEALYPNKNVEMLKQAPWTEVLPLLGSNGDEIMLGLLLDCGLFMPLAANKGVYCQISGTPNKLYGC